MTKTLINSVEIKTEIGFGFDGPSLSILILSIKSRVGIETALLDKKQAEDLIRDLQRKISEM